MKNVKKISARLSRLSLLSLLIWFMAAGGGAFACGFLKKSEPKVGEELSKSPPTVTIWLTEKLDIEKSWIIVNDAAGQQKNVKSVALDPTAITTKLPPLSSGTYKVTWHMTAKDCGHVSEGRFKFTVK